MLKVSGSKQAKTTRDNNHPNFRFYKPNHPITGKPCTIPKQGWAWPQYSDPESPNRSSYEYLDTDYRIIYGEDEKKCPRLKKFLHEVETNVSKTVINDYSSGEKEVSSIFGKSNFFSNPKPTSIIGRFLNQSVGDGDIVLDFYAGSGTTGHAAMKSDKKLKFILVEMGDYFENVLKPRIARAMYSLHWNDGKPKFEEKGGYLGVVKIVYLEQYEDLLSNIETTWDDNNLPSKIPTKYLFSPDSQRIIASLDLSKPFSQWMKIGREQQVKKIDLMETWCYLQGYWIKSRRIYQESNRRYLVVETTNHRLVIFRDINDGEDDSSDLKYIITRYVNSEKEGPVTHLEVNHDIDLRKMPLPTTIITNADFDRGAAWT